MTKELPRNLALAQLRIRSILAGVTILPTRTANPKVWAFVPNVGAEGTFDFPVTIYRGQMGEDPRSVTIQMSELLALARLETDSPMRAPIRENPPRLTAPPPAQHRDPGKVLGHVMNIMAGRSWCTLASLQEDLWDRHKMRVSTPCISARIRDLRKPMYGGHTVHRERVPGQMGLWRYRLELRPQS